MTPYSTSIDTFSLSRTVFEIFDFKVFRFWPWPLTLRGHLKSKIFSKFESPYMTSYLTSIGTFSLSRTVFEIFDFKVFRVWPWPLGVTRGQKYFHYSKAHMWLPIFFIPICLSHVPFHWNHTSRYSQWPHLSDGSWWGHFSYSSWFICCLRYCRSFHPSSSSSTLVWTSWYFSWLVLILSHLTFSSSLHPKFHFIFLESFLWCTSRFGPWPTSFHSLYNSSWLCHLKELNQIPPLCWWHPAVHSFTPSNSTSSLEMLSKTFSDILSWMNSNKLLFNPSKTEFLLIGTKQQRLKFSQLTTLSLGNDIIPVSSSACNLGFIFDSDMSFTDQINSLPKSCHFHIRDIRRIRHLLPLSAATALANSLVSSNLIIVIHSTMAFRKLT